MFSSHAKSADSPSTPPRSQPQATRSSLILTKPRVVETTAPSSSYNPFSPVKNKGKQRAPAQPIDQARYSHSIDVNPFATPIKVKSKLRVPKKELSPEPFPPIQPPQASSSTTGPVPPPAPTSAVSRARKRLRGEPVSPSPNKEKRRRVGSQASLPFPKLEAPFLSSGEENEQDAAGEANSSFVDDSPVKAPVGNKSFKLLFDEAAVSHIVIPPKGKGTFARSKTTPATIGLFRSGEHLERAATLGNETAATLGADVKSRVGKGNITDKDSKSDRRGKKGVNGNSTFSGNFLPRIDDLFSDGPLNNTPPPQTFKNVHVKQPETSGIKARRGSTKRTFSDAEKEPGDMLNQSVLAANTQLPLLPPSPPPADSSCRQSAKYKGKAKVKEGSRKKARVFEEGDEDEDEEDSPEDDNVKVVDRTRRPTGFEPTGDEADLDSDPILSFGAHRLPRGYRSFVPIEPDGGEGDASPAISNIIGREHENENEDGKFEVDLPDKLRRVLALSPQKTQNVREERVVRGLIYGTRVEHYDARKGGEIWDVGEGEDGEGMADTEGEDEWEGEPVPWEVGEL